MAGASGMAGTATSSPGSSGTAPVRSSRGAGEGSVGASILSGGTAGISASIRKGGISGTAAGDVRVNANLSTLFRLKDDTVRINGYFNFSNEEAPLLMRQYVSNHFIWKNDFGKTRRVKAGGWLRIPLTGTYINAGVENIQNLIYFGPDCLPVQHKGSVQVVSVNLRQNFSYRALNWQNNITYQVTSDQAVLPAPKLAINSNLFVYFQVARVREVQLGLDCDYYTHTRP